MLPATVSGMTDIDDALARLRHLSWPEESPYGELSDDYDEIPRTPLALGPRQRESLAQGIDQALRERGCDNTLRAAQAWARREKVGWNRLRGALEDHGGYCDCEVLMNVLPPPG